MARPARSITTSLVPTDSPFPVESGAETDGRYPYAGGAGQSVDPTADSTASRDSSPVKEGLVKLTDQTFAGNHGKTMKGAGLDAAGLPRPKLHQMDRISQ